MSNYRWVVKFLLLSLVLMAILASSNYILNNNYYFNHNLVKFEKHSPDERKYKANYIYNNKLNNDFDTVILGSSITTFLDQKRFYPSNAYNFAVNGMIPAEYKSALNYLEKYNSTDIETVILGLEFFVSNVNEVKRINASNIEKYLTIKDDLLSLIKYLTSVDNIIQPIQSLLGRNTKFYRHFSNVKSHDKLSLHEVKYNIEHGLKRTAEELNRYKYDENYKRILKGFVDSNKNKDMTVFISPQSYPYFALLLDLKFDEYSRWIRETVSIFGDVLYFNYPNEITSNYLNNYQDARHYTSQSGDIIVDDIVNSSHNNYVTLTMENVDSYLKVLKLENDNK